MKPKTKPNLFLISLFQSLGLTTYLGLISLLFWKGNTWFGPIKNALGPLLFLTLFVVSALISGLITLGYPFILFWEKKRPKTALKLVIYTAIWLIFFFFIVLAIILSSR